MQCGELGEFRSFRFFAIAGDIKTCDYVRMRQNLLLLVLGVFTFAAACDSTTGGSTSSSSSSSSSSGNGGSGGSGGQEMGGSGGTGGSGGVMAGCRTATDCQGMPSFCASYTLEPLCGGQPDTSVVNDCMMDTDCPTMNDICDATLCIVPHGGAQTGLHCRPGCMANADCGPGFACSATHHCEAATCAMNADCGSGNFVCTMGQCKRKDCTMDAECANFCVNGSCWANLGECKPAVP